MQTACRSTVKSFTLVLRWIWFLTNQEIHFLVLIKSQYFVEGFGVLNTIDSQMLLFFHPRRMVLSIYGIFPVWPSRIQLFLKVVTRNWREMIIWSNPLTIMKIVFMQFVGEPSVRFNIQCILHYFFDSWCDKRIDTFLNRI